MKVALLLSGLARKVQEGYDQYWKHVIENYDVDLYLHFWEDAEHEQVLKIYNPKKYICEPPKNFINEIQGLKSTEDNRARPSKLYGVYGNFYTFPMVWSWQQVYKLVDGEYDCVIRSRYDMSTEIPLDISSLDLTKLNISAYHWRTEFVPDDNLLITNQALATQLYTNVYDDFNTIIKTQKYIECAERNFLRILIYKKMTNYIVKTEALPFKLLREFNVWY